MELIDYIQSYIKVPPSIDLAAVITKVTLPKNYILHQEDIICRKLYFVQEGLARIFYHKKGKDITYSFVPENTFTTLVDSFFEQKPSRYNIELLEPSVVSYIKYDDLTSLFKQSHEIEHFGRIITTEFLKSHSERLSAIQFQTAAERYETLQVRHPSVLLRANLGHIASYLGITQETLSRLRGRKEIK
jgi:CRP-like cAMP-binding protein